MGIIVLVFKFFIFGGLLRPFTILIHELGHAIPALFFTKEKVSLYIGSYGDSENSYRLNIKRAHFYFKKESPFYWKHGLCEHDSNISIYKHIIIVICGPLASLVLTITFAYFIFFTSLDGEYIIIFFIFMMSSFFDFYSNISPSKKEITLDNGDLIYNDGAQLISLFKGFGYDKAVRHYNNKAYNKAIPIFKDIIESGSNYDYIYRLLISSLIQVNNYDLALSYNTIFENKHKANFIAIDFLNAGLLKHNSKQYQMAILDYEKSLELEPSNVYSLNNRGYTYLLMGAYELAMSDLEKAIAIDPDFAYSYNNLGFLKIKTGKIEVGLKDIKKSISLDDKNAYAYMNLGIYHFERKEYQKALKQYEIALELDEHTFLIQERIEAVKKELQLI